MPFSTCRNDNTVGPSVLGCRDDFDFTVNFEQLFFSITPSAIFILLSVWRTAWIGRRPVIVDAPILQLAKLVSQEICRASMTTREDTDGLLPVLHYGLYWHRPGHVDFSLNAVIHRD